MSSIASLSAQDVRMFFGQIIPSRYELLAGFSAVILTLSYLSLLFHFISVVGGVNWFFLEVTLSFAFALLFSRILSIRTAVALSLGLLSAGLLIYLATVPAAYLDFSRQISNIIALLTGLSILRMAQAGMWTLGFTPAPVFISWYFFFRREYTYGTLAGASALGLFVLTGDAGTIVTLFGVLGAIGAVGFGDFANSLRLRQTLKQRSRATNDGRIIGKQLTRRMVLISVATTTINVIPGGDAQPLLANLTSPTLEGGLVSNPDRVSILGSIRLSPKVRFTVSADQAAFWRVGAYDRFTGNGWIRTGENAIYSGSLSYPPTSTDRIQQSFRAESKMDTLPAAWKPVEIQTDTTRVHVTDLEGFRPIDGLSEGDQYQVESRRAEWTEAELRTADTDYPSVIQQRYFQLPETTPDRVEDFTSDLVSETDNPFDAAMKIKRWLETNKSYSLSVQRPDGDIAANFIFEMGQGYCVYYATAMVVMLRTQDIPARFVVGYTPGEQFDDNRWVVRGFHSHTWVEVYFPDTGWVKFDPTPADPRREAQDVRLQQARASNEDGVDPDLNGSYSIQELEGDEEIQRANADDQADDVGDADTDLESANASSTNQLNDGLGDDENANSETNSREWIDVTLPDNETILYGFILLAGVITGVQWMNGFERLYRAVWLRRKPRGTPDERVEGAFKRVEHVLGEQYRERYSHETPREYLESLYTRNLDERFLEFYNLYERTHYGGTVDESVANQAVSISQELIAEHKNQQ